jgi:putative Holliday junction resolvase
LIAFDYGTKTIGVAISDPLGITAQSLETVQIDEAKANLGMKRIETLIQQYHPVKAIIGLPKHMNNDEGLRADACRRFGALFTERFSIPVAFEDERLTTTQAEKVLISAGTRRENRKKYIDKLAAALILQNYLDAHTIWR